MKGSTTGQSTGHALLTVVDVAGQLRMSKRTVLDELRRRNLRGSKTPSGWRLKQEDVDTYLEAHANVTRVRKSA